MTDAQNTIRFILIPPAPAIEKIDPILSLRRQVITYDLLHQMYDCIFCVPENKKNNHFMGCYFYKGTFVISQSLTRSSLIFAALANEIYIICFNDQLNTELLIWIDLLLMLNNVMVIVLAKDGTEKQEYESLWMRATFSEKHVYQLSIEVKVF